MRLFLGVELDDRLRAACAAAAARLDGRLRARVRLDVRWVPEDNLHITLWFLGHVPDERVPAIVDRVQAPWDAAAFSLVVSGAGIFPPSGPPRIVWLGVSDGADALSGLYRALTPRLTPLGFQPERRAYHPHVTIGRVKDGDGGTGRKARAVAAAADVRPGSQDVRFVTLFESRLSPAGARYAPLLRVPLKGC